MNANNNTMRKKSVDADDAPELTDEFFERADEYQGGTLVRRGRPPADQTKEKITIRLSPEVLEAFRETGRGWQTRIDMALKEWVREHQQK